MGQEYLRLDNVVKIFHSGNKQQVTALDHISLCVEKAQFTTLLGPSGCGKTSCLRIIAGFETQDSGNIYVNGKKINDVPAFRRNMPMVFQNYALFPHLNVFENIAYGLRVRKVGRSHIQKKVKEICRVVRLQHMDQRYPGELSGGQQQRVALARALVLEPEIMLFDEPLSNLDAKMRVQTRAEIKRLQKLFGITVLYVTHDQEEALSVSDQVIVMNQGKVLQAAKPQEVYNAPADLFVADFIGQTNFITAQVLEDMQDTVIVLLEGQKMQARKGKKQKPKGSFKKGEKVILNIRPEVMHLYLEENKGFKAELKKIDFLGPFTEYTIALDSTELTVIQSSGEQEGFDMREGAIVFVHIPAKRFTAHKEEET